MAHAIRRSRFAFLFVCFSALHASSTLSAEASRTAADVHVEAIWQVQQVQFRFRSFRTSYACDALERKVAGILRALGARHDIKVDSGCFRGQFVQDAFVQVTLVAPVPATDENVRRATTFDSREELLARLQQTELPTAADLERFPATWSRVSLQGDRRARVDQSDCDLLRALAEQVFPRMSVRVEKNRFSCSSFGSSLRPRIEIAALLPVEVAPVAFIKH